MTHVNTAELGSRGSFSRVLPYVYAIAFLVLVEYRNYSVVMVKICHGIEDA